MRIFVTGASGYVGSAAVKDMLAHGHEVVGLARSETSELLIRSLGAEALRGDLTDLDILRGGASDADAVAHLAFNHDFSRMDQNRDDDAAAIAAMGEVLAGSDRAIVTTAATGLLTTGGVLATEDLQRVDSPETPRVSEKATFALLDKGVRAMVVRLSQINGPDNRGFVPILINIVREKGFAAYVGDGANRWPACHRDDAARLYRLAIEKGQAGHNYHAVAEEGITMSELASVIGSCLDVPVRSISADEAGDYFGWAAPFMTMDNPSSSAITRAELGWEPTGPSTLEELRHGDYFASS